MGGFFMGLLVNMLLNLRGLIPAAILLALHFLFDLSLGWAVGAAGAWLLWLLGWMLVMGWAGRASGVPDPPLENKNPYSAKKQILRGEQKDGTD